MIAASKGAAALAAGQYNEAIKLYTSAISQNPNAVDYYIKRSTAYQRTTDFEAALTDAEIAVVLAHKRAKRELIAQAQLRRGIALFGLEQYADAQFVLNIVKKLDEKEKSLGVWEMKVNAKLKGLPDGDERGKVTVKEMPEIKQLEEENKKPEANAAATASKDAAAPTTARSVEQTPISKIKHDWYQNNENIYFTLMAKGIPKDKATVDLQEHSISINFPTQSGSNYDYSLDPLFAPIDAAKSTYNITSSKLEMTLKKATPGQKWSSLEGTGAPVSAPSAEAKPIPQAVLNPTAAKGPAYPTSSRSGPKDWDKVASDLTKKPKKKKEGEDDDGGADDFDDDIEGGDEVNNFFKKLYSGADPDTKRAMLKSYQESNGTALSTNWAEVGKGPVATSPPDGMEAKKWNE